VISSDLALIAHACFEFDALKLQTVKRLIEWLLLYFELNVYEYELLTRVTV